MNDQTNQTNQEIAQKIADTVNAHDVVLYMKGTRDMPQCGFSARVAGVLTFLNIKYYDVNVLDDDAVRQGIKAFADWPTIPQLYIKGEFVGGCDIITEMALSDQLEALLDSKGIVYDKDAAERVRASNQ